jgi:solute carrier family 35 protein F5
MFQMFITLSSDFLYVIAMLKTTPLVVTIGLGLTIPVAVIGDFFLGKPAAPQVLAGSLLVLVAFIAVGVENARPKEGGDLLSDDSAESRDQQSRVRLDEHEVPSILG